jgi:hypothetical protein
MKRSATAADKRHLAAVAAMPCILCQHIGFDGTPAEVHHVRTRHGWGRSSHLNTIPLCPEHHRGNSGVHSMGRSEFAEAYGVSEMELLARLTRNAA